MRAHTCPASFSALNVCSVYSRVSTAFNPATTWKHSGWKSTPWYVKRIGSSLPLRRPRMRNSSAALLTVREPAFTHAPGEDVQQRLGVAPAQARIRDRDAVLQGLARHQVLAPFVQVTLDHDAHHALLALRELRGHVIAHLHLLAILLRRVGVREVDHEVRSEARRGELRGRGLDVRRIVVRRLAPAQKRWATRVADRLEDRRLP